MDNFVIAALHLQLINLTIFLSSRNDFLQLNDLVVINVAPCSRPANFVWFDVEDDVILSHEGAAHQDLIGFGVLLGSHTVLVIFLLVEVLARVPGKFVFNVVNIFSMKLQDRET